MEATLDLLADPRVGDLDSSSSPGTNGSHIPPAADADLLDAYSRAVVSAAERVGPAVVSVEVRQRVERRGRPPPELPGPRPGFVFPPDRLVLTDNPPVDRAPRIHATLSTRTRLPAAPLPGD